MLTGDELEINGSSYYIDYKDTLMDLGKLLRREKTFSHYYETYSIHNMLFVFENRTIYGCHNEKIFQIQETGYILK